jgi:hypothetical protein
MDLSTELEQLQDQGIEETIEEEKPKGKKSKAVKVPPAIDQSTVIADLEAENERLRALLDTQEKAVQEPVDPSTDLVTVYVPFNAQGVSRNQGFDPETGESYTYTIVKAAVKHEGQEHHSFEQFNIRLDSRVVVPRYVAEILGSRADIQEYFPEY